MRYAVLGGDMRFAHLVSMLNESGREAAAFFQDQAGAAESAPGDLRGFSCILSPWPMRRPLCSRELTDEEILENITPGSVFLLCGPKFPRSRRWDLQYVNLWEDEKLLQENAYLTAEGAAASAMSGIGGSLAEASCLVLGYGRIGRALTQILLNLGAKVTVVSGKENKRRQVMEAGGEAVAPETLPGVLPKQNVIFTTPPATVLDGNALSRIDRRALLIDLASPPYGFDLELAHSMGLQAVREPGLPGRYCPMSAARAIFNAVLRWEEKENYG